MDDLGRGDRPRASRAGRCAAPAWSPSIRSGTMVRRGIGRPDGQPGTVASGTGRRAGRRNCPRSRPACPADPASACPGRGVQSRRPPARRDLHGETGGMSWRSGRSRPAVAARRRSRPGPPALAFQPRWPAGGRGVRMAPSASGRGGRHRPGDSSAATRGGLRRRLQPDGRIAHRAAGSDGRVWDIRLGRPRSTSCRARLVRPGGRRSSRWSRIASASEDKRRGSGTRSRQADRHPARTSPPSSGVAFSPDGRQLASASEDGTVKLWKHGGGRAARTIPHPNWVPARRLLPDGATIVTACQDGLGRMWDVRDARAIGLNAISR